MRIRVAGRALTVVLVLAAAAGTGCDATRPGDVPTPTSRYDRDYAGAPVDMAERPFYLFADESHPDAVRSGRHVKLGRTHRATLLRPASSKLLPVAAATGTQRVGDLIGADRLTPWAAGLEVTVIGGRQREDVYLALPRTGPEARAVADLPLLPAEAADLATAEPLKARFQEIVRQPVEHWSRPIRSTADCRLSFSLANPSHCDTGARFTVDVIADQAARRTIFEATLPSLAHGGSIDWQDFTVDLAPFAGQTVRFIFRSEAATEPRHGDHARIVPLWGSVKIRRTAVDEPGPAVVLISLDTLRADRLGAWGYERPTSPAIDRLAADSFVFSRCRAPASLTLPSHFAVFTGLHPYQHPRAFYRDRRAIGPTMPTLARIVGKAGLLTAAFTEGLNVRGDLGFAGGFDLYSDGTFQDVGRTFRDARSWLEANGHLPFFLFVHTYAVHMPYSPPEEFRQRFSDGDTPRIDDLDVLHSATERRRASDYYDACVAHADSEVGALLALLDERGILDRALLVLMSDHGEEFWEHGQAEHGKNLHVESMHVPLLVRLPGSAPAHGRVERPVALHDVFATILDVLGLDDGSLPSSRSLLPLMMSGDAGSQDYDRTAIVGELRWPGQSQRHMSLFDGDHSYLVQTSSAAPPLTEVANELLYDVRADDAETRDLVTADPGTARRLRQVLETHLADLDAGAPDPEPLPDAPVLSAEELAELEALGYLDQPSGRP